MKNRKMMGILLLLTVAVWGGIMFRMVRFIRGNRSVTEVIAPLPPEVSAKRDSLLLNYRDPFLRGREEREAAVFSRRPVLPLPVSPPSFRYHGQIRKGSVVYALVECNGITEMIAARENVDGFTIRQICRDSLIAGKKGKRFTVGVTHDEFKNRSAKLKVSNL